MCRGRKRHCRERKAGGMEMSGWNDIADEIFVSNTDTAKIIENHNGKRYLLRMAQQTAASPQKPARAISGNGLI
jgi:hypothetical protein